MDHLGGKRLIRLQRRYASASRTNLYPPVPPGKVRVQIFLVVVGDDRENFNVCYDSPVLPG